MPESNCPICGSAGAQAQGRVDFTRYDCRICGRFRLSEGAEIEFSRALDRSPVARGALIRAIVSMQRGEMESPEIREEEAVRLLRRLVPIRPPEQANHLILWLGRYQSDSGSWMDRPTPPGPLEYLMPIIGACSPPGAHLVLQGLCSRGLVENRRDRNERIRLSMDGWEHYEALEAGDVTRAVAFMAMQYGDSELDQFVDLAFRPAVEATGFVLRRLDDDQPAGLIDDRLRVEIRTSRFLIADLTHENRGAYWEAGYAEGLGKPVIYTCRQDVFDQQGTHFDTNHHLTVPWDPEAPDEAARELKATIRATLPGEARMVDDGAVAR